MVTAAKSAKAKLEGEPEGKKVPEAQASGVLVVTGPAKGRRRAGFAFGPIAERIPLALLSEDQIAAIAADPELASHREEDV